jgi:hypothetical protein
MEKKVLKMNMLERFEYLNKQKLKTFNKGTKKQQSKKK